MLNFGIPSLVVLELLKCKALKLRTKRVTEVHNQVSN